MRVVFSTRLFEFASTFEGEVFTSNSDALPQPILPGDASEAIATNSLRVLSAEGGSVDFVRDLQRSTGVLTPNGDGVNDGLTLRCALFRLPGPVPVLSKSTPSTGTDSPYRRRPAGRRTASIGLGWTR